MSISEELISLAQLYGIQPYYLDEEHKVHYATTEPLLIILNELDIPIIAPDQANYFIQQFYLKQAKQGLQPVTVSWDKNPNQISLFLPKLLKFENLICTIEDESSGVFQWQVAYEKLQRTQAPTMLAKEFDNLLIPLPALPLGYYTLTINAQFLNFTSLIVVAPQQPFSSPELYLEKKWGLFAPVYSLRSSSNFGCGDLHDLEKLALWCKEIGGNLIGSLPINPTVENQQRFNPYRPESALYWNEIYLDLNELDWISSENFNQTVKDNILKLQQTDRVDYFAVRELKRKIIQDILQNSYSNIAPQLENYLKTNRQTHEYAQFKAQYEEKTRPLENLDINYRYHLFVQWQMDLQLQKLKTKLNQKGINLYFDMPIGVERDGFDVYFYHKIFCSNLSRGKPPNKSSIRGEDWSLPLLNPQANRNNHYQYLRRLIHKAMQFTNYLRIDNAMNLTRQFCIPKGVDPKNGVVVTAPCAEYYAIFCLESVRNKVILIEENINLPTAKGLIKSIVIEQQWDINQQVNFNTIPQQTFISFNKPEMPTFSAYLQSLDLKKHYQENPISLAECQRLAQKRKMNLQANYANLTNKQNNEIYVNDYLLVLIRLLLSSKHHFLINIEDLWLEIESQYSFNSNWSKKLKYSLEEIVNMNKIKTIFTLNQ